MDKPKNRVPCTLVRTNLTDEERKRLQGIARSESRSLAAQVTVMLRKQLSSLENRHETQQ